MACCRDADATDASGAFMPKAIPALSPARPLESAAEDPPPPPAPLHATERPTTPAGAASANTPMSLMVRFSSHASGSEDKIAPERRCLFLRPEQRVARHDRGRFVRSQFQSLGTASGPIDAFI